MLYLVATPIGNLEDITQRALRILAEVDFILAEDTRKTGRLLIHFAIKKKLISFYEHNENEKAAWVVEQLKQGKDIALVSSAGVPTISDPGYKLIRLCRELSLAVTALPGASSVINALALSSLPHDKFSFLGYLPRKSSQCKRLLETAGSWKTALVCFESPYRIKKALALIKEVFCERKVSVVREMTKKFEEVVEGSAEEVANSFKDRQPKGEFVIIISV